MWWIFKSTSFPAILSLPYKMSKSLGLQTCRVSQSGACVFKHVSTHTHEIYLLSPYWYFKFKFRTRGCLLNHFHTIPVDPILHTQNPHSWQHRGDLEYPIITRLLYPFSCVRLRTLTLAPPGKRLKTAENPLRHFPVVVISRLSQHAGTPRPTLSLSLWLALVLCLTDHQRWPPALGLSILIVWKPSFSGLPRKSCGTGCPQSRLPHG